MGIIANIYKHKGQDYSNLGLSWRHDYVCVVNADGPFEPNDKYPPVLIVKGPLPGTINIVPAVPNIDNTGWVKTERWTMFGGTFVYANDSRFGDACAKVHNEAWVGALIRPRSLQFSSGRTT